MSSAGAPSIGIFAIYGVAAIAEIAGCFAIWSWIRLDRSAWWLIPGTLNLITFAYLLTWIDSAFAGRAYAAYGGVYIAASLFWLWSVEGQRPDRWDALGGAICLLGAGIVIFGPRNA